jgi:hypothetical protein
VNLFIGIDPGITGAIVVIDEEVKPQFVSRIPVTSAHSRKVVDVIELIKIILRIKSLGTIRLCVMEDVGPNPAWGRKACYTFGGCVEALRTCFVISLVPFAMMIPRQWKKHLLPKNGMSKEEVRQYVLNRYPSFSEHMPRKSDHDIAEAILLAKCALVLHRDEEMHKVPTTSDDDNGPDRGKGSIILP